MNTIIGIQNNIKASIIGLILFTFLSYFGSGIAMTGRDSGTKCQSENEFIEPKVTEWYI